MKRRNFIRNSSLATVGTFATPSVYGLVLSSILAEKEIEKVHLIFKTHLDIGFTNLAEHVIKTYNEEFIPQALKLSENMRKSGIEDRFVWTTGSWLIYQFLEKAKPELRKRMENAIESGDILWHGLPFTTHSELADTSLFDLGIQLSKQLDKRFGKKTIAAKMTDVPGHTRGIIPVLQKNEIDFLHIGVNPASTPPDVPALFKWQTSDGSDLVIMYQKTYGSTMVIPGTQTAVAISFTGDNHGPQKTEEIAQIYSNLRKQFPNAKIVASTLNNVAHDVNEIKSQLPIIKQELGDTWIHGIASDPLKIAHFKEISRLRKKWLEDKTLTFGDSTDLAFGIPLLMVAEHTWGLDVKTWLKDWDLYQQEDFLAALPQPKYKMMEKSWDEKREYIIKSISQLPEEKASIVKEKIEELNPTPVYKQDYLKVNDLKKITGTHFFDLKLDENTGAIKKLTDKKTGYQWAKENNPLALFSYQTFSAADYDRFLNQYLTHKTDWAFGDFGKTGQESGHAISKTWLPILKDVFQKQNDHGEFLLLSIAIKDENGRNIGGSPNHIQIEHFFPKAKKEFHTTLQWFNKPAYRLPEAFWFSFIPSVNNGKWTTNKFGLTTDFTDVVKDGNRNLHALSESIHFTNNINSCSLESFDAPLVAPGEKTLLNFDNRLPEITDGMHFCLHNNVWGTNFRMWFADDMKYRFEFKA